jgi:ankyrin repeat protein
VEKGDVAGVKNIVKSGADVSKRRGILGMTPLMHAARAGNIGVVTVLLDNGSPVNAQATTGSVAKWTALSFAAAEGHVDIVKLLLERGADIDMALTGLESGRPPGSSLLRTLRRKSVSGSFRNCPGQTLPRSMQRQSVNI